VDDDLEDMQRQIDSLSHYAGMAEMMESCGYGSAQLVELWALADDLLQIVGHLIGSHFGGALIDLESMDTEDLLVKLWMNLPDGSNVDDYRAAKAAFGFPDWDPDD
jgi:hypothetical protein